MPRVRSILETVLDAPDLGDALSFYGGAMGLRLVSDGRPLMLTFRVDSGHVLLVFDPARSAVPARPVPSSGAQGPGHVAFRIDDDAHEDWVERLGTFGVDVEQLADWSEPGHARPGRSIYCRDPAGNSVELITADIWPEKLSPGAG